MIQSLVILGPSVVCEDKFIWKENNEGKFSIKSCYELNFTNKGEGMIQIAGPISGSWICMIS